MTILFLLFVIVVMEVFRFFLLNKPRGKKDHFRARLKGVEANIYDLEFKIFKAREIRETIRRDRDDRNLKREALNAEIENKYLGWGLTKEEFEATHKEKGELADILASKLVYKGVAQNDRDEFKRLIDQKILLDRDIKRFEDQMRLVDIEINGEKASAENPQGAPGITDQIDSFIELKAMLKDWIKRL